MARALSIARSANTNGNLDTIMAFFLLAIIGLASANTMADTNLTAVQNGIHDFSHYSE